MTTVADAFDRTAHEECSTNGNVTRSLLRYLALAGPCYIVVSMTEVLTR